MRVSQCKGLFLLLFALYPISLVIKELKFYLLTTLLIEKKGER